MKILITGATGFIGSHIVNLALNRGHSVYATRRNGSTPRIPLEKDPTWLSADINKIESTDLNGVDTLIHLASHGVQDPGNRDWNESINTNIYYFTSIIRKAVESGINNIVVAGSCFEYGSAAEKYEFIPADAPLAPTGAYNASKAASTMFAIAMAQQYGLRMSVLRPFHVYGPGEPPNRLWQMLKNAASKGIDLDMTFGKQIRDFIPVSQVASAFLDQCEDNSHSKGTTLIKNIGTGNPESVKSFSEYWWEHWNAKGKLCFGALAYREHEVMRYVPDLTPVLIGT